MTSRPFLFLLITKMAKKQVKKHSPELPAQKLQALRKSAENLVKMHDLAVHDVSFGPTDFGLTLSVVIKSIDDRPLSISDCEVVSRPLSKELDVLMEDFSENYLFEVTSIGIKEEESDQDESSS